MGQRSQLYVIAKQADRYYLTARYYGWNFGERMISRARGTLENIIKDFLHNTLYLTDVYENSKLSRIMDVNWDMHDVIISQDIVEEFNDILYEENGEYGTYAEQFYGSCFCGQDNNNGQMYLFVDLDADMRENQLFIGFCSRTVDSAERMLSAEAYLNEDVADGTKPWDEHMKESEYYNDETIEYTRRNIEYISENAKMLDRDRLEDILQEVSKQYEKNYLERKAEMLH